MKSLLLLAFTSASLHAAEPPRVLTPEPSAPVTFLQRPDGSFAFFYRRDTAAPVSLSDASEKSVSLRPHVNLNLPAQGTRGRGEAMLLGPDGELHEVWTQLRDERKGAPHQLAVNYFIDIWHTRTRTQNGRQIWEEPRPIWRGYTGAVMGYLQLRSGRLLIPFGSWLPGSKAAPPAGTHAITAIYSDDQGRTWQETRSRLTSPCHEGYNGNNYGACEPVVVELDDGRLWMLMRSQTGFLYESYSNDQGVTWTPAQASRFPASTGPPAVLRDAKGRLHVVWNHCEMPPRVNGAGVYGGRDALHAAISTDSGRTWSGFREIYRDATRNTSPPRAGDRGTAYPRVAFDEDGNLIVLSGQGAGRRKLIQVDPEWLLETSARTDFSDGLDAWHVFTTFGPSVHWWRDRTAGGKLIPHPAQTNARWLQLGKPGGKAPDGAAWNFPIAWKAKVTLQVRLNKGSSGGSLALTDRFFDPTDDQGERLAAFHLRFTSDGRDDSLKLTPGAWHELTLNWDLDEKACQLHLNGTGTRTLPLRHPTLNGLSYLRLRSLATGLDRAGFLVSSITMHAGTSATPPCSAEDQRAAERRYVDEVIATWRLHPKQNEEGQTDPARVNGKPVG